MKICTIGFTQKSAEEFFNLLKLNNIKTVIDVRLNKSSQLAGFAKSRDLKFFLKEILSVEYIEDINFAPTKEILDNYKKKNIDWNEYEIEYSELLKNRNIENWVEEKYIDKLDNICLLCSEPQAEKCHRRLAAEIIKRVTSDKNIEIMHL